MMTPGRTLASALALALSSANAFGADLERAQALREEGKAMLKKARGTGGDPIRGSHDAIEKLQEAAALLEDAAQGSSEAVLLQDINSLIFWTRRTTPLDIRALIRNSSNSSAPQPSSKPEPAKADPSDPAEAAAALAQAEAYARSHPDDPVTCAARFFEIADRYKDIHDVAFKAISRMRESQRLAKERTALREAEAKFAGLARDGKLEVEGDRAYAARDFERAALKYGQAIAIEETAGRRRKLGHALFERAQELRAEYSKAYLAGLRKYNQATRRRDARGMKRARNEAARAGRISKSAIMHYERAEAAFRAAWNASGRVDLDAEMHMALTFVIRREAKHIRRAKKILERILLNYHDGLATDEERTLYACVETYAGPALVSLTRRKIARRAGAAIEEAGRGVEVGEGGGSEDESGLLTREPTPREMSDDELKAAVVEIGAALKKHQHRLNAYQVTGRFDKKLLDKVNAETERLKELEREVERRGLR